MPEKETGYQEREGHQEPSPLGKITLLRHAQTEYTDVYPDLTETGQEEAAKRGREIKQAVAEGNHDVMIASSPNIRAQGTADIIKKELKGEEQTDLQEGTASDDEIRIMRAIRSFDIHDRGAAMIELLEHVGDVTDVVERIKKVDVHYAHDDRFEDRVDLWEPRSKVEKRFFRGMEYAIRSFTKYNEKGGDKLPHLVAVSHFEFLNHFVEKVFKLPKEELLDPGEKIEIDLLKQSGDNENHIILVVTFRDQTREIVFDRETRSIEIAK